MVMTRPALNNIIADTSRSVGKATLEILEALRDPGLALGLNFASDTHRQPAALLVQGPPLYSNRNWQTASRLNETASHLQVGATLPVGNCDFFHFLLNLCRSFFGVHLAPWLLLLTANVFMPCKLPCGYEAQGDQKKKLNLKTVTILKEPSLCMTAGRSISSNRDPCRD
jgi:hypothetical protein